MLPQWSFLSPGYRPGYQRNSQLRQPFTTVNPAAIRMSEAGLSDLLQRHFLETFFSITSRSKMTKF